LNYLCFLLLGLVVLEVSSSFAWNPIALFGGIGVSNICRIAANTA
jgi:hypothetical protein